jgi:hypothetical protein
MLRCDIRHFYLRGLRLRAEAKGHASRHANTAAATIEKRKPDQRYLWPVAYCRIDKSVSHSTGARSSV